MEPKLPAPNIGPEYSVPQHDQVQERRVDLPAFETGIERGAEQFEQRGETVAPTMPPVLPTPVAVPLPTQNDDVAKPVVTNDTPLVANDDDLIEREWVDKAKKIIDQTRDDPHRREQEVSKLQADYLQKRYGKELGASQ